MILDYLAGRASDSHNRYSVLVNVGLFFSFSFLAADENKSSVRSKTFLEDYELC